MGYTFVDAPMNLSEITFPLFKQPLFDIGYLYIPFFAIIVVGCSNAENLTDGLDGLAALARAADSR